MTVDEYLRSSKGVPPIPERWTWEVQKATYTKKDSNNIPVQYSLYDVYILDENNDVLSKQTYEPMSQDLTRFPITTNENFLTVVQATYFSLYRSRKPDLPELLTLPNL